MHSQMSLLFDDVLQNINMASDKGITHKHDY